MQSSMPRTPEPTPELDFSNSGTESLPPKMPYRLSRQSHNRQGNRVGNTSKCQTLTKRRRHKSQQEEARRNEVRAEGKHEQDEKAREARRAAKEKSTREQGRQRKSSQDGERRPDETEETTTETAKEARPETSAWRKNALLYSPLAETRLTVYRQRQVREQW